MKYIGITGHRGSGKNTTAYLLGNILERIRRGQSKESIEIVFPKWCETIRKDNNAIYDTSLYFVYFDEFGELPKSMVSQLLGIDMGILDNDFMKDNMYVNLKDFTLHRDVVENVVDSAEVLSYVNKGKTQLVMNRNRYISLREFVKMFSVDIMQKIFGTNVWLKSRHRQNEQYGEVEDGWRIFTDVKIGDELLYIKDKNGVIIEVNRPVNRKKDNGISNIKGVNVDYNITIMTDISEMFEDLYKIAKDIYEDKDNKIHYGQDCGILSSSD
jgi:hypothetical protein